MSRCLSCGLSFDEQDGWQDYCSPECLYDSMVRSVSGRQREKAQAKFKTMIEDPAQRRRIRFNHGRAIKPQIGRMTISVRPMTDQERRTIRLQHMRSGFSCGHQGGFVDALPSQGGLPQAQLEDNIEYQISRERVSDYLYSTY